jgi:type IV pilus assembly protein PilA
MLRKSNQKGFTIVELLIVIVVIGILAALVITTFTGIQQRARNTERETDIKALHSQFEAYYAQFGDYPTGTEANTATFRSDSLRGLDNESFVPPNSTNDQLILGATPSATQYAYEVTDCDATSGDNCQAYVLRAELEGDVTLYERPSLN